MRVISFLFFGLVLALSYSCNSDGAGPLVNKDELLRETVKDVEILYSDSAMVKVRVSGPLMYRFTDLGNAREEFPKSVKLDFFNRTGDLESWLTSKKGTRYSSKGLVVVQDSVVLQNIKKEKLETEELTWDEKIKKVYTSKFARITTQDEVIFGYGFEANQDLTEWKIKLVQGRLKVENPE
jgi:LPS export ABC transporter protein LptC